MKLGKWHHRRGGKWMVDFANYKQDGFFQWVSIGPEPHNHIRCGLALTPWTARRRAIAALAKMTEEEAR